MTGSLKSSRRRTGFRSDVAVWALACLGAGFCGATPPHTHPTTQPFASNVPTVDVLSQALRHGDVATKRRQVSRLEFVADVEALRPLRDPLLKALRDEDADVRVSAITVLGKHRAIFDADDQIQATVPWLTGLVQGSDRSMARSAMRALGAAGAAAAPAVPLLVEKLHDPEEATWRSAAEGLGRIGPPAVAGLSVLLFDADPAMRERSIQAFRNTGKQDAPAVVRGLAKLIRPGGDPLVVVGASFAVCQVDPHALSKLPEAAAALPLYRQVLRGDDRQQAMWAAAALASLGPPAAPAVEDLLTWYRANPDPPGEWGMGLHVGVGIAQMGEAAVPELAKLLATHPDPGLRALAATAMPVGPKEGPREQWPLNDLRNRQVIGHLLAAAHDPQPEVRARVMMALGTAGRSEPRLVLPVLRAALADPLSEVRQGAVTGLGVMSIGEFQSDVEVRDALRLALHDGDPQVRQAAAGYLKEWEERKQRARMIEGLERQNRIGSGQVPTTSRSPRGQP